MCLRNEIQLQSIKLRQRNVSRRCNVINHKKNGKNKIHTRATLHVRKYSKIVYTIITNKVYKYSYNK